MLCEEQQGREAAESQVHHHETNFSLILYENELFLVGKIIGSYI